jgi:hypothetical protein
MTGHDLQVPLRTFDTPEQELRVAGIDPSGVEFPSLGLSLRR